MLDLNFIGQAYTVKHVGRQMLKQEDGGSIVLTAAGAGIIEWPDSAGYTGGKAACNVLAQTAALDFIKAGATNIRMNTICPGGIRTPMMDHFKETMPDIAAKALGGGRNHPPCHYPVGYFGLVVHLTVLICARIQSVVANEVDARLSVVPYSANKLNGFDCGPSACSFAVS